MRNPRPIRIKSKNRCLSDQASVFEAGKFLLAN